MVLMGYLGRILVRGSIVGMMGESGGNVLIVDALVLDVNFDG